MKFTINEKKVSVTQEVHDYAEKKISKLDRFFKVESEATIMFSALRGKHIAEITINNNGMFYRVSESTGDMHATIDSAVAAIERQIRKHKTRLAKRLRDNVFEREAAPDIISTDDGDEAEETDIKIVRTKAFPIKPMTPEEAVLQMELLDHAFYVFKNQNRDEKFSVVYKRKQGDYGMIESLE